jgi:hypothetical protein
MLIIAWCAGSNLHAAEMVDSTLKTIPKAPEKSVSTFLKSEAATGQGLALNIVYPEKVRYPEGAPIAVVVPDGDGPNGLNFCMHAPQVGFVEIRFSFPGGRSGIFASGGDVDYRGSDSQLALRDIILFAMGKTKDYQGRTINELVPVKLAQKNLGLVGWSNGGNIALVTMDKFADELAPVSWIAFYESPLGSLFFPSSLGSTTDLLLNRHYRQGSAATGRCLIDFRKLAYEKDTIRNPGIHKKLKEPEVPGVVYYDENGNKKWDESTEFAFNFCLDKDKLKQFYAPDVTAALERHKVFEDDKWPGSVATLKESETYFQERDGGICIPSVCSKYPELLITVFGSHVDHLQRQPDHPHIVMQYNSWLDNGARWVRLNPEPIYLSQIANMSSRNFVENPPNSPIDASNIADHLEREGMLNEYVFMDAAIAELADRKRSKNINSPLDAVLVNYTNGVLVPPLANANSGKPATSGNSPKTSANASDKASAAH